MGNENVVLTILQYNMLVKKLEVYENKLNEIHDISSNLSMFNRGYEVIADLSEVKK